MKIGAIFMGTFLLFSTSVHAIVGGVYVPSGEHRSVVGIQVIFSNQISYECTATVVGAHSLMTADHCTYSDINRVDKNKRLKAQSDLRIFQKYAGSTENIEMRLKVSKVQSANDRSDEELIEFDLNFDQADFAVLTVDEDLEKYFTTSELALSVDERDELTVVGYGRQHAESVLKDGVAYGPAGIMKTFADAVTLLTFPRVHMEYLPQKKGK